VDLNPEREKNRRRKKSSKYGEMQSFLANLGQSTFSLSIHQNALKIPPKVKRFHFSGTSHATRVFVCVGYNKNFPPFEMSKGFTGSGLPLQMWGSFMKELKK